MFDYRDLFQWERFITPSIIKIFYWLAVGISILGGVYGLFVGLFMIPFNLFAGLFYMITSLFVIPFNPILGLFGIITSVIGVLIAVLFARIISEFVLIMFRINEHLGAIRQRGQM